jgi:hypothetical protein
VALSAPQAMKLNINKDDDFRILSTIEKNADLSLLS